MITLYLDMDGVIADFNKEYMKLDPNKTDRKRFRSAVIEDKIFEKLDFMPDAAELLNHVSRLNGINIEILTSMGTHVHSKVEKAAYATPTSILIDDSIGCITPFNEKGGHGILHTSASETNKVLDSILLQLKAIHA